MKDNSNDYELKQEDKTYILSTSIIDKGIRILVKKEDGKIFLRDFTLSQFKSLDQSFNVVESESAAIEFIDNALKVQKVGIYDEENMIKIIFYVMSEGMMNQIQIPLGNYEENQTEAIENTTGEINSTENKGNIVMGEVTEAGEIQNLGVENGQIYEQSLGQTYGTMGVGENLPIITPVEEDNTQQYNNMEYVQNYNYQGTMDMTQTSNFQGEVLPVQYLPVKYINGGNDFNMGSYEVTQDFQTQQFNMPISQYETFNQNQFIDQNMEQYTENVKEGENAPNVTENKQEEEVKLEIKALQEENANYKKQIEEYDKLKKDFKEMTTLTNSQLSKINSLKEEIDNMKSLKKQLEELVTLKAKVAEAEELKKKVQKYEKELKELKSLSTSEIKKTEIKSENKLEKKIILNKTEQKLEKSPKKNEITFEEKPIQFAVKGTIIHSTKEIELITRKINKFNKKIILNLLYKATVDSDKASAFHLKCDEAQSSLVLVETDQGKRFGGFTTCSWSGNCEDKKDENAFVFSLDKMKIYSNIPGEEAIGCYPTFGPIFLGCQIKINDNAFENGGTTFEKGLNYNTEEDYELTDGDRVFNVKEIEVYEVIAK